MRYDSDTTAHMTGWLTTALRARSTRAVPIVLQHWRTARYAAAVCAFWIAVYAPYVARIRGAWTADVLRQAGILGAGMFISNSLAMLGAAGIGWHLQARQERRPGVGLLWALSFVALALTCAWIAYQVRSVAGIAQGPVVTRLALALPHFLCLGLMFVAMGSGVNQWVRTHARTRSVARLEAEVSASRLEISRTGLRIGCLIGWIDRIKSQINSDAARADDSLIHFAHLLRLSLERSRGEVVTVRSEIEFASAQASLERSLGREFELTPRVPGDALGRVCPHRVISVLVDAAMRALDASARQIVVVGEWRASELVVTIEDDGRRGVAERTSLPEWENIARLRRLLAANGGGGGMITLTDVPGGGVRMIATLPITAAEEQAEHRLRSE